MLTPRGRSIRKSSFGLAPSSRFSFGGYHTDTLELLNAHALFRNIDRSMISRVAARAVNRHVNKGSVIYRTGDPGSSLHIIISGAVRLSRPSNKGKAGALKIIFPGDVFGELAFLDGDCRVADAVAMQNSALVIIERRDFLPVLYAYPQLAVRLIEMLCKSLRRIGAEMDDVLSLGLSQRLAKTLLYLHDRDQEVRVTQLQISQMVGATRENTNKYLSQWQKRSIIRIERASILVRRPAALLQLANAWRMPFMGIAEFNDIWEPAKLCLTG